MLGRKIVTSLAGPDPQNRGNPKGDFAVPSVWGFDLDLGDALVGVDGVVGRHTTALARDGSVAGLRPGDCVGAGELARCARGKFHAHAGTRGLVYALGHRASIGGCGCVKIGSEGVCE